jgi:hypothetical protein
MTGWHGTRGGGPITADLAVAGSGATTAVASMIYEGPELAVACAPPEVEGGGLVLDMARGGPWGARVDSTHEHICDLCANAHALLLWHRTCHCLIGILATLTPSLVQANTSSLPTQTI